MPRIVVIGALVYDMIFDVPDWVEPNRAVHATQLTISPGGKGLNQAAAAAKLGARDVQLVGCVGDDMFGMEMLAALRDVGVSTQHIRVHRKARTSIAAILVREQTPGFIGAPDASRQITKRELRKGLADLQPGDVLLVGFELPQRLLPFALELAKAAGATTVVNPAPFFTRDKFVFKYLRLIDWLIPNVLEAELITGAEGLEVSDLGFMLLDKGVGNVIITFGEEGSLLVRKGDLHIQDAFLVDAVDTTGASDAYVGAFCVGLAKQWDIRRSMRFASAAAALACTRRGTMTALPSLDEVEALLAQA